MRITGGKAAGIRLETPPTSDQKTRPATDRLREAVFSSLGEKICGSTVLDLFAGIGTYGLEALSRGASHATFVEINRKNHAIVERNLRALKKAFPLQAESRLFARNACEKGPWYDHSYDFVFIDPPYEYYQEKGPQLTKLFEYILSQNPDSHLCVEMPGDWMITSEVLKEMKRFGKQKSGPSLRLLTHANNTR